MIEVESIKFSNFNNKNFVMASRQHFRVIEEIGDIDYVIFEVSLFMCKWIRKKLVYKLMTKIHTG